MRAFVCHLDHRGLRTLLPEELVPACELGWLAPPQAALIWALLDDPDAEALRAELRAGRHRDACDMLADRAVEILPLSAVFPC